MQVRVQQHRLQHVCWRMLTYADVCRCECSNNAYSKWPLARFYVKQEMRQHKCFGGSDRCEYVCFCTCKAVVKQVN
jgi:hypothetical protein